jgi:hypothetical protein
MIKVKQNKNHKLNVYVLVANPYTTPKMISEYHSLLSGLFKQCCSARIKITTPVLLELRPQFLQSDRDALLHVVEMALGQYLLGYLHNKTCFDALKKHIISAKLIPSLLLS